MAHRMITDDSGRMWTLKALETPRSVGVVREGRDVTLACVTDSIAQPIRLVVGWQWERMSPKGLARLVVDALAAVRQ